VITIDDLTSEVAGIARAAVSLCRAEAHAAAVSKPAVRTNWYPTFALAWRLPELRQVLRRCLNRGRQCISSRFSRAGFAEAEAEGEANLDRGALTSHRRESAKGLEGGRQLSASAGLRP